MCLVRVEPTFENIRELDWSQAKTLIGDRIALMEPDALSILRALRMHEYGDSLDALVDLFGSIDLIDGELAFDSAIKVLDSVYSAFDRIDVNHDHVLSRKELEDYRHKVERDDRQSLDWVIRNFLVLKRASLVEQTDGISQKDLLAAGNVFRGLKHIQSNFDEVSEIASHGEREVTPHSIERYLARKTGLSLREKAGLKALIVFIRRIAAADPEHDGLTRDGLAHLSPDCIFASVTGTAPASGGKQPAAALSMMSR